MFISQYTVTINSVQSTHGLEVQLSHKGQVLDYMHFLMEIANQKMEENLKRIEVNCPLPATATSHISMSKNVIKVKFMT
uniref:Uncharacterized protein n=1 Tax=Oncorhynchus tshawytscha TaxID=74940 RepID=A0A8C8CJH5_ONCTS